MSLIINSKYKVFIIKTMQVIEITGISGHSPYNIVICDMTKTYCYVVATGIVTIPPTLLLDIPTPLQGSSQVMVIITDASGCETIQIKACPPTPTPTPTITPTPTPTMVVNCNCLTFINETGDNYNFGYTQCDDTIFYGTIYPYTTLYVCGRLPFADPYICIYIGSPCVDNTCPLPTPTPSPIDTESYLLLETSISSCFQEFLIYEDGGKIIL
jgi:hypothetical protein